MAISLMPDASASGTLKGATKRQKCELLRAQLELERASFVPVWQDCNNYCLPWRARFQPSDVNRGNRRNQNIIDNTPTLAQRTLSAGMTSGITNPSRPWFQITTGDPSQMDDPAVKQWCHDVQVRIEGILLRSNIYDKFPVLYGDLGTFGTAALLVLEDDETVVRGYDLPVGSYSIANDARLMVSTLVRPFRRTVQQCVEKWGDLKNGQPAWKRGEATPLSLSVQTLWNAGTRQAWVDLVHVVQPNESWDDAKVEAKYKRFESVYYEIATVQGQLTPDPTKLGILQHEGFDEFPALVARWESAGDDVYATNWPGLTALGDIKELQLIKRRQAQATEKWINPPVTGPAALRGVRVSTLPGDVTYNDAQSAQAGLRAVYELSNPGAALEALNAMAMDTRERIKSAFYVDLILMMAESDRKEITAREIDERHEEKMLAIGPVLSRLNTDVLKPLIERVFNIARRRGLLPPPPPALQNAVLDVEFISIMQQALKQVSLSGLERFASFVGQLSQFDPSILDVADFDVLAEEYGDATGILPKILRSPEQVQALREQKAKAQQAAQAAENAPKIAGAARDLSQAQTGDGGNVLQMLLQKQRAKQTLNATAQPPASVLS